MDISQVAEINLSQLNYDTLRKLDGKPALIKFNRRVHAILLPVDDREDTEAWLHILHKIGLAELEAPNDETSDA